MKVTVRGYQELSLSNCCVIDPCNIYRDHYMYDMLYLTEIHCEVEIDQEIQTYKYWMALRFAKDDDKSPSKPLKDMFLQKYPTIWFNQSIFQKNNL